MEFIRVLNFEEQPLQEWNLELFFVDLRVVLLKLTSFLGLLLLYWVVI